MPDTFRLEINLGNEAMQGDGDVANALCEAARSIAVGGNQSIIRDANGNTVGRWYFDSPAPQLVSSVQVHERDDGLYLFHRREDAERFATAVDEARGVGPGGEHNTFVGDEPIHDAATTDMLIAAERSAEE